MPDRLVAPPALQNYTESLSAIYSTIKRLLDTASALLTTVSTFIPLPSLPLPLEVLQSIQAGHLERVERLLKRLRSTLGEIHHELDRARKDVREARARLRGVNGEWAGGDQEGGHEMLVRFVEGVERMAVWVEEVEDWAGTVEERLRGGEGVMYWEVVKALGMMGRMEGNSELERWFEIAKKVGEMG